MGNGTFFVQVTSIDNVDGRSASKHHIFPALHVSLNGILVGTDRLKEELETKWSP